MPKCKSFTWALFCYKLLLYAYHVVHTFCWLVKKKMSSTALQSALDQLTLYPMLNKLSWDWFWFWCFPQNEFQSWDAQTAEGPISSKGTNHLISPFLPNLSTYFFTSIFWKPFYCTNWIFDGDMKDLIKSTKSLMRLVLVEAINFVFCFGCTISFSRIFLFGLTFSLVVCRQWL